MIAEYKIFINCTLHTKITYKIYKRRLVFVVRASTSLVGRPGFDSCVESDQS